jgi:putative transposase
VKQRALCRCKKNSKRRYKVCQKVTQLHYKSRNTRRTYLHQVSRKIVNDYDLIAVEKLNIKGLASGMLSKQVHDVGWGLLNRMLRYKAEKAGAKLVEVASKYTSQDCSGCGVRVKKELSERTHNCPECGLTLDRDVNAARNVLHKAVLGLEGYNVTQWSERTPRNISVLN